MSAPNQGRQSPEPERQSESQAGTQAGNPNDQNAGPGQKAGEESKNTLENLSSNPKGPLDDEAAKKTTKN
jgi:hypothetical protein